MALARCGVEQCETFDELIKTVDDAIRHIDGIGDLFIYDAAVSIGAKLGLEPEKIYLHAGTRRGAGALGLGRGKSVLDVGELPRAFRALRPREIEDCLCIYKDQLREIKLGEG